VNNSSNKEVFAIFHRFLYYPLLSLDKEKDLKNKMISLISAPRNKQLKIMEFSGGHGVRRRLLSLGLHKNDIIELDSHGVFGGAFLIKDLSSDTSVALGRGVASKIMVEIVDK